MNIYYILWIGCLSHYPGCTQSFRDTAFIKDHFGHPSWLPSVFWVSLNRQSIFRPDLLHILLLVCIATNLFFFFAPEWPLHNPRSQTFEIDPNSTIHILEKSYTIHFSIFWARSTGDGCAKIYVKLYRCSIWKGLMVHFLSFVDFHIMIFWLFVLMYSYSNTISCLL